jgi:hypothetical protein
LLGRITAIHEHRCRECHTAGEISRLDWVDLHVPERTLFLGAPLPSEGKGTSRCPSGAYEDKMDPDYLEVRDLVEAAVAKAWVRPRRDLKSHERTMP